MEEFLHEENHSLRPPLSAMKYSQKKEKNKSNINSPAASVNKNNDSVSNQADVSTISKQINSRIQKFLEHRQRIRDEEKVAAQKQEEMEK